MSTHAGGRVPTYVPIDPRGKSPYWYCAYTLPNGKRRFKSTKQTDRKKAEEFRISVTRAARAATAGDLTEQRARELISDIVQNTAGEQLQSIYYPRLVERVGSEQTRREGRRDGAQIRTYR